MATAAIPRQAVHGQLDFIAALQDTARFFACASLPLGGFALAYLGAGAIGLSPVFFTPFGLPHWIGVILHLAQLGLLGAAFWALAERSGHGAVGHWLIGLGAIYIAMPFLAPMLDTLQLSLACTALFLAALATIRRAGAVSPLAGWLMSPMLAVTATSAALGLIMAAAYTPPFALMQTGHAQPPA